MQFYAKLSRKSAIYREWRAKKRLSGKIDDVLFKLVGFDFTTDNLSNEDIDKLRVRQDNAIIFEITGVKTTIKPERVRLRQG